jgi:methyl-accepting chemotaxis protein
MNLNINKKLLLLAALSALGLASLSMLATHEMGRVYTGASFANDNTVPALQALANMEDGFDDLNLHLWQRLAQPESKDSGELDKALREDTALIESGFKRYEPTVVDDKDRAMLAADRAGLEAFVAMTTKAIALIDAGRKDEARFLVLQNQAPIAASNVALDAHKQYNAELGQQGAAAAAAARSSATWIMLASSALIAAIVLAIALLVRRAIIKPLEHAGDVLVEIGKGNLQNSIVVTARDELGKLLDGLLHMQDTMRERTERERGAAERERMAAMENGRIRTALDRVSAGAMLADVDGKVIYLNDSMKAIFRSQANEIRRELPQFDPEAVLGSQVDDFSRSAQGVRLSAVAASQQAEAQFGKATLRLIANPVTDAAGQRIGTVIEFADRTQEVLAEEEVQAIVASAVDGDLTRRLAEAGKSGFFKTLAVGMNRLLENMSDIVRTMATASRELREGAEEISKGNTNLSQRTEEQASSLEQTASSMEEITSTVKNSADNAGQANQLAAAARKQAEQGGTVVGAAVTAMGQINESSKRIADIIGVIDEIAFQTNLLALNAAVEAARAGEQGRGFAVVASEVRSLAGRSATAAKEIKTLIKDSVAKVEEGSHLVEQSGQTLAEIVVAVKKVTDIVSEIAAGTQEQSSGIEQVNKAVMQMDETTQQNAALVEQAAAASQAIVDQTHALNAIVARYKVDQGGAQPAAIAAIASPQRPRTGNAPGKLRPLAPMKKAANSGESADGGWESF